MKINFNPHYNKSQTGRVFFQSRKNTPLAQNQKDVEELSSLLKKKKINADLGELYNDVLSLQRTMSRNKYKIEFSKLLNLIEALDFSHEKIKEFEKESFANQQKAYVLANLIQAKLVHLRKFKGKSFNSLYKENFLEVFKTIALTDFNCENITEAIKRGSYPDVYNQVVLPEIRCCATKNFQKSKIPSGEYIDIMKKTSIEIESRDIPLIKDFLNKGISLYDTLRLLKAGFRKIGIDYHRFLNEINDIKNTTITLKHLQNDAGYELILEETYRDNDFNTRIKIIKTFNSNGLTTIQRREMTTRREYSTIKGLNKAVYLNVKQNGIKDFLEFDFSDDIKNSTVLYSTLSDTLSGAFSIKRFHLGDYPQSINIAQAILSKQIKSKDKLSEIKKQGAQTEYSEKYTCDNIKTQRKYSQEKNIQGQIIKSDYKYLITDNKGNELLNLDRSWKKYSKEYTYSKINDYELVCFFDYKNYSVKVLNLTLGTVVNIDLSSKMSKLSPEKKESFMQAFSNLHADALLDINRLIDNISYSAQPAFAYDENGQRGLEINYVNELTCHELGHALYYCCRNSEKEIEVNELVQIYNSEMEKFKNSNPQSLTRFIWYFSQTGGGRYNTGLEELIAETYLLLNTYNYKKDNELITRAHFLVRYFPQTIAKIAQKLGY